MLGLVRDEQQAARIGQHHFAIFGGRHVAAGAITQQERLPHGLFQLADLLADR
jgi:hypothetical protein